MTKFVILRKFCVFMFFHKKCQILGLEKFFGLAGKVLKMGWKSFHFRLEKFSKYSRNIAISSINLL